MIADTGYQGIQKIHNNSELPKKKSKKNPLTKNDKKNNRILAGERVINENVIGMLKRFKIIANKYRNRRKRFGLCVKVR
ncbi:DDE superendonuclease family protein [Orientia tsutsugamushi str. UT144]|uniref:DDE superendonuclease family protein n=1 Tax=Orientia tsutsugamushi str. UT144 TaxID=1441384 RepID=A0A0F3RJK5_ORITS|nr:DDE superendonuclease family protein [Orientia tsutsugamushi str. UT144]